MTLYEMDQALLDLMEAVDPETGEWAADPEAWEQLNLARGQKLEDTACFIKDLRVQIEAFKAEIRELQRRQKVLENKEAWLMENLRRSLDGANFETTRCALRFKRNPESVRLTDADAAMNWALTNAPDCLRYKPATLSLSDLKAELKKGTSIPGAELVQDMRLEVK